MNVNVRPRLSSWLKRFGAAGFAFFLLKGLLWLSVPWLAHTLFS